MNSLELARLVALAVLLLALGAPPAFADVEASAAGNIVNNTITGATINPVTGISTISGNVTCSAPTSVEVYASVRQLRGMSDQFAQYFGASTIACDTTPTPYDVTVTPGWESDRLVPGPASINAWATYCASGKCYGTGTDSDRLLMPSR
jgi:hypothetical protein